MVFGMCYSTVNDLTAGTKPVVETFLSSIIIIIIFKMGDEQIPWRT